MDEKMFELLEKMYIEVQDMKSNMATKDDISNMATKDDISNMATKDDISNMATKDDISNIEQKLVVMEDKMDRNHKALYDGYKLNYEKLEILEVKVDKIERNVEKQDVEIRVIKGVR